MLLLTGDTSQQREPQEPAVLIQKFERAIRIASKAEKTIHPERFCRSAEKAIVYYRSKTWSYQRELGETPLSTNYPERKKGACAYKRFVVGSWRGLAKEYRTLTTRLSDPEVAIRYVFGQYAEQALAVSWCESRYHTTSQNGQYLGLFQMGSYARSLYGHSNTAFGQARSAYAYFVRSGRDWSPWSCKPY